MIIARRARAGVYAEERYRRGLRAYRRRMRTPLLVGVIPIFVFFWLIVMTRKLDPWSLAAGALMSAAVVVVVFVRDDPPQHVANWGRGADGERKTERALRPLERKGWTVEHDVQHNGKANLDHIVRGPCGIFLLETKNLAGTVSFENNCLTARQFDDPDEVYRYKSLAGRLRGQAMELSARIGQETGHRPWVNAVVVVWGQFPNGFAEHEKVAYVSGERLAVWLESGVI